MSFRVVPTLATIAILFLVVVASVSAQDNATGIDNIANVQEAILKKRLELMELSKKYGPGHPEIRSAQEQLANLKLILAKVPSTRELADSQKAQVKAIVALKRMELAKLTEDFGAQHPEVSLRNLQIRGLEEYLSRLESAEQTDEQNLTAQLKMSMLRFADTMDQLGNQIERIEQLGHEMGVKESESRTAFHESSETMFLAAKTHFAELEKLMGENTHDEALRVSEVQRTDKLLQAEQARQVAEAQETQALAMERAVAELIADDPQKVLALPAAVGRIDQLDERLSRIEKLLEKLIKVESESDSSEGDR